MKGPCQGWLGGVVLGEVLTASALKCNNHQMGGKNSQTGIFRKIRTEDSHKALGVASFVERYTSTSKRGRPRYLPGERIKTSSVNGLI